MGSPRFCKKGAASWLEVPVLLQYLQNLPTRGFWFWECRLSQPCLLAETVREHGNTNYRASAHTIVTSVTPCSYLSPSLLRRCGRGESFLRTVQLLPIGLPSFSSGVRSDGGASGVMGRMVLNMSVTAVNFSAPTLFESFGELLCRILECEVGRLGALSRCILILRWLNHCRTRVAVWKMSRLTSN